MPPRERRLRPSDWARQLVLSAKGAYHFALHPTSRATFTAFSEAIVRFRANRDFVTFVLEDPDVARLCRERYVGRRYTREELLAYPPGSLGQELGAAMKENDFDPHFYRGFYGDAVPEFKTDEEYLRFRVRQLHDIAHVLTGFAMTEFPGELGMQAFLAAQTRRPFSIGLVGFGMLRIILVPQELPRTLHEVAKGFAMGYAARQLLGQRFEEQFAKPVAQWRLELGLVDSKAVAFADDARAPAAARPREVAHTAR
ncbi:MAG TPA: Coq4 family protein [Polyangiaceae bacterium]|nr:Coq4 family protein [Polyangiaceae bacterium]